MGAVAAIITENVWQIVQLQTLITPPLYIGFGQKIVVKMVLIWKLCLQNKTNSLTLFRLGGGGGGRLTPPRLKSFTTHERSTVFLLRDFSSNLHGSNFMLLGFGS